MIDSFLSLGSNIGNRYYNLQLAIEVLSGNPRIEILSTSPVYESSAMYNKELDNFYNSVIHINTKLSPLELLNYIKKIENKMGRKESKERYSPRPIDIDILSYGNQLIESVELNIPHPHIKDRNFVLIPWSDIDSDYVLPNCNKNIAELLEVTSDNSILNIVEE